jgi:hypothetical protein
MPGLSAALEDPESARNDASELLKRDGAVGYVAISDGRPVAYRIGAARADVRRGRHVRIDPTVHAVAPEADAGLKADLYSRAAAR